MAIRRRRRRTVPSGRKFVWARASTAATVTGLDPTAEDLLSEFEAELGAQLIGATIVRIRGVMMAAATNGAANSIDQFRVGVRVTSGNFDVTAPTPADSPWDDDYADWMLYEPFISSTIPVFEAASDVLARKIDVKAQRRIEEIGEQLVLLAHGNPGAPTITWGFAYDLSIGIKLP